MKKTFSLVVPGKDPQRVLELVRNEVGKYVNREKRKAPPIENGRWEFECRVGPDEASAVEIPVKEVHEAIGKVAESGASEVFVKILASAKAASSRTQALPPSEV